MIANRFVVVNMQTDIRIYEFQTVKCYKTHYHYTNGTQQCTKHHAVRLFVMINAVYVLEIKAFELRSNFVNIHLIVH